MGVRLAKRTEEYGDIKVKDITHKTWFFPENLKGTHRYYNILRHLSPLFKCLLCFPKRYSNGITIIGLEDDRAALIKELNRIIRSIEGCHAGWKERMLKDHPTDEHKHHLIAENKDHYAMMVRSDIQQKGTYLWSKRVMVREVYKTLEVYFKNNLANKKHRKVKWQIV